MEEDRDYKDKDGEAGREEGPELAMPAIALRGLTVFPSMVLHFDIGREKSVQALEKAMILNQTVFLIAQKDADAVKSAVEGWLKKLGKLK